MTIGIIFAKNIKIALMVSLTYYFISFIFCDFLTPLYELNPILRLTQYFYFNLTFRSLLIIIFGERCETESQALTYFRVEEDQLWFYLRLIIYQAIIFTIIGYIALLFKANNLLYKIYSFIKGPNHSKRTLESLRSYDNPVCITTIESDEKQHDKQEKCLEIAISIISRPETIAQQEKSLALGWYDLTYSRSRFLGNKKQILKRLKGKINFGSLTALMGPSGAGKTSLLRCINGINQNGLSKETRMYISKNYKLRSCFIVQEQREHLLMNLTVKESLLYASLLKNRPLKNQLDQPYIQFDHKKNIDNLVNELMLTNCFNTKVSRCSGGEQKRLSIGLELTAKMQPNLICIDEPTTGLDSHSAEKV